MKKLILILNVSITVITLSSCELDDNSSQHQQGTTTMLESSCIESGEATINSQETTNLDDYSLKIIYVQERVLEIIDNDCFQNGSLSDKVQLVEIEQNLLYGHCVLVTEQGLKLYSINGITGDKIK